MKNLTCIAIFFALIATTSLVSCKPCFICEFEYFKNAEDQLLNKNVQKFISNSKCGYDITQEMRDFFETYPFRKQDSFVCKKSAN